MAGWLESLTSSKCVLACSCWFSVGRRRKSVLSPFYTHTHTQSFCCTTTTTTTTAPFPKNTHCAVRGSRRKGGIQQSPSLKTGSRCCLQQMLTPIIVTAKPQPLPALGVAAHRLQEPASGVNWRPGAELDLRKCPQS